MVSRSSYAKPRDLGHLRCRPPELPSVKPARRFVTGVGLLLMLAPMAVHAHLVSTRFGDFYGGLLHPLVTLQHLVPMLAVGLLAGLQEPRTARWILVAMPLGLLCGVGLAVVLPGVSAADRVNEVSLVVVGLLVAGALRLPPGVMAAVGWLVGLSHGYGNGLAMTTETTVPLFSLGVVAAGFVLVALVSAATIVLTRRADWLRIAVRAAGSWIAAIGLMVAVV